MFKSFVFDHEITYGLVDGLFDAEDEPEEGFFMSEVLSNLADDHYLCEFIHVFASEEFLLLSLVYVLRRV